MDDSQCVETQKARLRRELQGKLERLKPEAKRLRSQEILTRLFNHPKFSQARSLSTYLALPSEVETRPLLKEARGRGKKVYVPWVDPEKKRIWMIGFEDIKELKPGLYGILEPVFDPKRVGDPASFELIIVPGIGFDREGGRLGRGGGYYDRFLKEARQAYKIGLAFECQIVERVPRESGDIPVDEVLAG